MKLTAHYFPVSQVTGNTTANAAMVTGDPEQPSIMVYFSREQGRQIVKDGVSPDLEIYRQMVESAALPETSTEPVISIEGAAALPISQTFRHAAPGDGIDLVVSPSDFFMPALPRRVETAPQECVLFYANRERKASVVIAYSKKQTIATMKTFDPHVFRSQREAYIQRIRDSLLPNVTDRPLITLTGYVASLAVFGAFAFLRQKRAH